MSGFLKGRLGPIVQHRWFGACLTLLLGLLLVSGRSVATDEAFTWGIVRQPDWNGFWDGLTFVSGNMGVYFFLLRLWSELGDGVVWLRLPSVLFCVGTVWLIHVIGRTWFDRRTAAFASILAATSVPLLYYAIEIRSYSFVALTATLMWYFFERALRLDRWSDWIGLALAAGLTVSGHVIMALALPAIGLLALYLGRASLGATIAKLVPLGVAILPTALLILVGDGAKTQWIPGLDLTSLARAGRHLLGDHAQYTGLGVGFVISAAYAVLYAIAGIWTYRRRKSIKLQDVLLWLWLVSLPATIVAVSIVEPLLWHRYLIGSLPAGILVIARVLAADDRHRLAIGVVAALALLGVVRSVALRSHSADEYETVAELIESRSTASDAVVIQPLWARAGLDYYWRDGAPVTGDPDFGPDFDRGETLAHVDWVPTGSRIWVVERSDSSQVFVDTDRDDEDFDELRLAALLPDGYELSERFDVQRFRIWLYEPS